MAGSTSSSSSSAPLGRVSAPPMDVESLNGDSRGSRFYNSCITWIAFILAFLLLLAFIVGCVYYAILQSNLPEAQFHRLDIKTINMTSGREALLTADLIAYLNVTNRSDKLSLKYGPMTATMDAHGIKFPAIRIKGMRQRPTNMTDIKIRFTRKDKPVEKALAVEMQGTAKEHMMTMNMVIKGYLDLFLGQKHIQGVPIKIDCTSIDQYRVDSGKAPKCNVKISLIS